MFYRLFTDGTPCDLTFNVLAMMQDEFLFLCYIQLK